MDKTQYVQEGYLHLQDDTIYERIDYDYSIQLAARINLHLKKMAKRKEISQDLYQSLRLNPDEVKIQRLYFLRKLHKRPHAIRPIVSATGRPTEITSAYMDQILSPYMRRCHRVIDNSIQVIHRIQQQKISPSAILATLDIKSLYLTIPQAQGTSTVLDRLYNSGFPPKFKRSSLEGLLKCILKDNFFIYRQDLQTEIRSGHGNPDVYPTSPTCSWPLLKKNSCKIERKAGRPLPAIWLRYIDDIILIWEHDEQTLKDFLQRLNRFDNNINFTLDFSNDTIDFLDINIYKGNKFSNQGLLDFQPYRKACHKNYYLRYDSCHPANTFKSIVRGEAIRLLKNSSDIGTYLNHSANLFLSFLQRGYPLKRLQEWTKDLLYVNRDAWLQTRTKRPFRIQAEDTFFRYSHHPGHSTSSIKQALHTELLPFRNRNSTLAKQLVKAKVLYSQ